MPHPDCLPADLDAALLVGRVLRPGPDGGPAVVVVRGGEAVDLTRSVPTVADLLDRRDAAAFARSAPGEALGSAARLVQDSLGPAAPDHARLLAPCDLQAIKACGVTFVVSLLERVLEERAGGDPARAEALRAELQRSMGADIAGLRAGSPAALRLKAELQRQGAWSQYLEVGLGTDAEVFTKSQPMSAVGLGAEVGLHPSSSWNNPEPEIVLAVDSRGTVVGATLGNDVNLRDVEGRSALLLGKAKDNNASCAIGPFVRLFDAHYTMDDVRAAEVGLEIEGADDGFRLEAVSAMREINRDPLDLVAQTCGAHHQYPDGFMLFLGTMFSPTADRGEAGRGFSHRPGDRVSIATPRLGRLVNTVRDCTTIAPWDFGVRALYDNLARRGLWPQRP